MYARCCEDNRKGQLLCSHLKQVSDTCSESLRPVGMVHVGEVLGLLHDFGKCSEKWQLYLMKQSKQQVNHASGGVYFLARLLAEMEALPQHKVLEQALTLVIQGHHGSLRDGLSPQGSPNHLEENIYTTEELKSMEQWFFTDVMTKTELESRLRLASIDKCQGSCPKF